jgi:hypothetical protein
MPVIRVEYDDAVVTEDEAHALCTAAQKAVIAATGIKETFVYGNTAHIKIDVAPIEIWVEMSAYKVKNAENLARDIRNELANWKNEITFPHLINLTLTPVEWKLELDI